MFKISLWRIFMNTRLQDWCLVLILVNSFYFMYYPFADRLEGRGHHSPATSIKSPSFQKKQKATLLSQRQITVSHSKVRSSKRCRKTKIYDICVFRACVPGTVFWTIATSSYPTLIIHTPITLRCMDPIHLYNAPGSPPNQASPELPVPETVVPIHVPLNQIEIDWWSRHASSHRPFFVTYLSGFEIQATESWTFCIHKS